MTFGEKVKYLRKKKHLTQENLAENVGVHPNTVSQWEHGVIPRMSKVIEVANILGTTSEYLLQDESDTSSVVKLDVNNKESDKNDFSFMRDLIKSSPMMVYENGNERFFVPATSEGFKFLEKMRTNQMTGNLAGVR